MPRPSDEHRRHADEDASTRGVPCGVLTISDTRTLETDASGDTVVRHLEDAGHVVADRRIVRDDGPSIAAALDAWIADDGIAAALLTGGTGLGRRDTTIEVVRARLTAELDGFGELFRVLSFEEIGAAAMLSRAVAGLVARAPSRGGDTFVFAMPGSPGAVTTAMSRLIVPELPHLVWMRME